MSADKQPSAWSSQGREGLPDSLRNAESPRQEFNDARDPFARAQRLDMQRTEKERREQGDGSKMIKMDKPFPELKPANSNVQKRKSFNNELKAEKEAADRAAKDVFDRHQSRDPFERSPGRSPGLELGR